MFEVTPTKRSTTGVFLPISMRAPASNLSAWEPHKDTTALSLKVPRCSGSFYGKAKI